MNKHTALSAALLVALTLAGQEARAEDSKLVAGFKKVGSAIVWPFKKMGEGLKAIGNKLTGK